jgi:plastocyanin
MHQAPYRSFPWTKCDPATFNAPAAVGPDFCKNIALGASTTFSALFAKAAAGTPGPNREFEPDTLTIKKGTIIHAVNQGGEPHTFTKVAKFGGGFIPGPNAHPSRKSAPSHGSVARGTLFSVLHSPVDAHDSPGEINQSAREITSESERVADKGF